MANTPKKKDEDANLSEVDRLKKENEALRSAARLRDAKDEAFTELQKAGNNSPELAFRAIKEDLVFDEATGKPTNLKDLVDGFKTSYPEQFGTAKPQGGVDAGASGPIEPKLSKAEIERMSTKEINERWQDVKAALDE